MNSQQYSQEPFWDFIRSFDPNTGAANPGADAPEFLRGFPFFARPEGPHGPGRRPSPPRGPHHHPRGPHPPRGPAPPGPPPPPGPGHHGPPHPPHHGPHPHPPSFNNVPFPWAAFVHPEAPWFQQQGEAAAAPSAAQAESIHTPASTPPNEKATPAHEDETKEPASDSKKEQQIPYPAEVAPEEDEQSSQHPRCRNRESRRSGHGRRGHHQTQQPFDLSALLTGLSSHPFLQNLQEQAANAANPRSSSSTNSSSSSFTPALDLFNTPSAYILHLSLPGAKKSDIGVEWKPDAGELTVAGVVHRPGDEAFLNTLVEGERRTGVFERSVALPPKDAPKGEEVDGDAITAKMEDGVLIVTVPKLEKEWTEIRKVDIE